MTNSATKDAPHEFDEGRDILVPCESCGMRVGEWCKHVQPHAPSGTDADVGPIYTPEDVVCDHGVSVVSPCAECSGTPPVPEASGEGAAPPERIFVDTYDHKSGRLIPPRLGGSWSTCQQRQEVWVEYIEKSAHKSEVEKLRRRFQTERDAAQVYSDGLFKIQDEAARLRQALRDLPDLIPTSWLDSLLTGSSAVVGKPPYSGSDIEILLRAVKKRVADAALNSAGEE